MATKDSTEPVAQHLARRQLRDSVRRLIAALDNIYTTPRQGQILQRYIQRHMFAHLDITTLPLEGTASADELSDVACSVVTAFFGEGMARELGWSFLSASQEQEVSMELHGVVTRLLLLPAKKIEWRAEWTEALRQAADEPRANVTAVTQAEQTEYGVGGAAASEDLAAGGGRDEDGDNPYSAEQASMWTAIQEANQRRERQKMTDAEWAAEVENRLANADVREEDVVDSAGYDGSDGEETLSVDEDLDGGVRLPGTAKEAVGKKDGDCTVTTTAAGEQGVMAVEIGVHRISNTHTEPGLMQNTTGRQDLGVARRETGLYDCTVCKEPFGDAIAVNEHYVREHIEE